MTIHELRELFLKEHKRDKRLTIINYIIICLCVLIVLGLIAFIFIATNSSITGAISNVLGGSEESGPWYAKYVLIAVFGGMILYPFYHIWKLSNRPKKIEELLTKIEAGSKATSINDVKEYKITIPILKVNLKLCPVTQAIIYLDSDVKPYSLPINSFYLADMKILLSGGNVKKLNDVKKALYSDEDSVAEEVDAAPTVLKSTEEFRTFLNENLKETIDGIEKERSSARTMMMVLTPIVILIVLGVAGYYFYSTYKATAAGDYTGNSTAYMILPFFLIVIAVGYGYSYYMRKKASSAGGQTVVDMNSVNASKSAFNEAVFGKIIKFINPTVEYMPIGHIGLPEFLESGLFQEKNYNIDGNDQISGRHSGVPFIMCELNVSHTRNFSDEKDGPASVFYGQFFVAKFNKKFSSPVYIKPRKGFWATDETAGYTYNVGEKIRLEDPEFMEMFDVYGTDQIEARYILTPTTMERIKNIAKRTKGRFYVAFNNNKITITNSSKDSKFGVGFFDSLTKNDSKLLVDFYENIRDQFAIIDELKLNRQIWK